MRETPIPRSAADTGRPARRPRLVPALSVAVVLATVSAAGAVAASPGAARPTASTANVTVDVSGPARGALTADFLGLSFESNPVGGDGVNGGQFDAMGNLPRLLSNLGPGVLRFGGNSVDRTYTGASPQALDGLRRLSDATGWRVLYSVNLGHFDAAAVTADAKAVSAALGHRVLAVACGNEPNVYGRNGHRPAGYGVQDYLADANACIAAVHRGAPGVPIAGPDTIGLSWLPSYASAERGRISLLDQHYYPLSNCKGPSGTATDLLSRTKAASEAQTVDSAAADARTAGVPLRLTETNSASCGGITGASNTFAAALWAVDYVAVAAEHGASGINLHGGLDTHCGGYTPLCQTGPNTYAPAPVYYGLLLAHLLGQGDLLPVTVSSTGNVAAHAVRGRNGLIRVVVENLDGTPATITLAAGRATGSAGMLHLTAASLEATGGVQIQGAAVEPDGGFTPGRPDHVVCAAGRCPIRLAPYTAAVITLPPSTTERGI